MTVTPDDLRAKLVELADRFNGCNAETDRARFGALCCPSGPENARAWFCLPDVPKVANSSCGVVAVGLLTLLARSVGITALDAPMDGQWWPRVVALAKKHGAFRGPKDPVRVIGAIVYVAGAGQHWFTTLSDPSAGPFDSFDGGDVTSGMKKYQRAKRTRRQFRGQVEIVSGKTVVEWIDGFALLLAVLAAAPPSAPVCPTAARDVLEGIDVSANNGAISWGDVRSAVDFAYLRATIGAGERIGPDVDANLVVNANGARAAGLPFGLYGVLYPRHARAQDADVQARGLARRHRETGATLRPMVDVEDVGAADDDVTGIEWRSAVELYLSELEREGLRPIVYAGPAWWLARPELMAAKSLARFPLWLASYTDAPPVAPAPWSRALLWQYQAGGPKLPLRFRGQCRGVRGDVDRNHLYGSLDDLRA